MEPALALRQKALETLAQMRIDYDIVFHPPAATMEEIAAMGLGVHGEIPKNLFLCDHCGRRHILLVVCGDKRVNLRAVARRLQSSRLSFADEGQLERYLGVKQGSVTPLAVLNDGERAVEVVFDVDLQRLERVGVHPNDNRATVFLRFSELYRLIEAHGNPVRFLEVWR